MFATYYVTKKCLPIFDCETGSEFDILPKGTVVFLNEDNQYFAIWHDKYIRVLPQYIAVEAAEREQFNN